MYEFGVRAHQTCRYCRFLSFYEYATARKYKTQDGVICVVHILLCRYMISSENCMIHNTLICTNITFQFPFMPPAPHLWIVSGGTVDISSQSRRVQFFFGFNFDFVQLNMTYGGRYYR